MGAALTFAGTNRFVDRIEIPVGAFNAATTATFELALYTDAGNAPGSLLWSGNTTLNVPGISGPVVNAVFLPNTIVPNTVFYTLAYSGLTNTASRVGPRFNQSANATVGSHGQVMSQDSTTLAQGLHRYCCQWDPTRRPEQRLLQVS